MHDICTFMAKHAPAILLLQYLALTILVSQPCGVTFLNFLAGILTFGFARTAAFAFALVSLYCPKKPFLFRESFFVSNSRDKRFTLSQIFSNSESRELFSVSSSLGCSMRAGEEIGGATFVMCWGTAGSGDEDKTEKPAIVPIERNYAAKEKKAGWQPEGD